MVVYEVSERRDDLFVKPDRHWRKANLGSLFCPQCYIIDRRLYPAPIDAMLDDIPRDTNASAAFQAAVGVVRVALLDLIRPLATEYAIGKCLRRDGSLFTDFCTMYSSRYLYYRGEGLTPTECPHCHTIRSAGSPLAGVSVSRSELFGDVMQNSICRLVLTERAATPIRLAKFTGLVLRPIRVVD